MKRDLEKEKQLELAAIWGSETDGNSRFPKRKGSDKKSTVSFAMDDNTPIDPDVMSDFGSDVSDPEKVVKRPKKTDKKKKKTFYRLHCFVGAGTEKNAVRTVFDDYEPKVELRQTQKGNALNKSQFAVLTFKNKAMALHAVQKLDGSNQRDLLGVKSLKLNLMLDRHQSKIVRRRMNQIRKKAMRNTVDNEIERDAQFIQQFISRYSK
ncbi:hypothetical protein AGDE_00512 [Angomonas deanei]|uniref:Uncharacterized protein n=1 Tax=Angomonas deanei TaxID=59799 RepID=A0A7G2CSW3_9TRYP|nr:hypothetical protein AGDE_00512 [Angomonas deanei]CAD2222868.1 hypothetical protein, conserved [Angomonas deanei]|eukprot:EPY43409.1 hypothetical protein AGDE_00512 [Angomonas deanei]